MTAKEDLPGVIEAAQALQEQLDRFASTTDALQRTPLDSQKHLERSARLLNELAATDEVLASRVQELISAFSRAREQQQAQAQLVQARAEAIRTRTGIYQELLERFGALGRDASALNELMRQLAEPGPNPQATFEQVQGRMDEVVRTAEALTVLAREQEFSDVARQADALRQQLLAARNKLSLLHQRLTPEARS